MLTAVLHGKAGRVEIEGRSIGWRELFRKREDLLTGVLFGRLSYLSDQAHDEVLSLLLGADIAKPLGRLQAIEFWPKLGAGKRKGFVEPDVLIDYSEHRVLVEVKPPHSGAQRLGQWRAEVEALLLEEDESRPVVLLALGRNSNHSSTWAASLQEEFIDAGLQVVCREWQEVVRGLAPILARAEERDSRILQDWLEAFGLFGMTNECAPFRDLLDLLSPKGQLDTSFDVLGGWRAVSASQLALPTIDWQSLMPLVHAFESDERKWK
ncbi:hypothetical protein [Pseudomonas sp. RC3H12]|uniref:hypothetical protein n=1 Tax=Pseudomonas sp. RC3H12 TaxID=2834406 RepID=UPI001BDF110C|nr:hypothetical protein [Pseudomonas sp. RC3H12]QWA30528.1 hypothetical protein KHO27_06540 [Pseudomonas sp. RC3H12]